MGDNSLVANLAHNNSLDGEPDASKPYAELWMGDHPSGMSSVSTDTTLKSFLTSHPEVLGAAVVRKYGLNLPFLFKVLSVRTALSIQAHPDMDLAQKLYTSFPDLYKDPNHKPEMAIAVTQFEALCGFRGLRELNTALEDVEELSSLLGHAVVDEVKNAMHSSDEGECKTALKKAYAALCRTPAEPVKEALQRLVQRLHNTRQRSIDEELIIRLNEQYPGDIGVFSVFFLNYIRLQPGQAIFLGANEPHAYLSGDCIECMACSDNVVRAGLTPKFRDVDTLLSMLTYKMGVPDILQGERTNDCCIRYSPPVEEFEVSRIQINAEQTWHRAADFGPSILLVLRGEGSVLPKFTNDAELQVQTSEPRAGLIRVLAPGNVFLVPAGVEIFLEGNDLEVFLAACNRSMFL
eukprot:GILJ01004737.1.p1 GENE.GILJ01004737.1~~GILJ01004737.1.p1  ORF type:complete len:434 (+),score=40.45 GILJ01004737.1:86-1303(+)